MDKTIYLFYGEDEYVIKSKINQLLTKNAIDDFNVTSYDAEETDVEEAINDAATIPFMSDYKAIIIKNCYFLTNKNEPKKAIDHHLDAVIRYLGNPSSESLVIFHAPYAKLDERKAITKEIMKHAVSEKCAPLKQTDLKGWTERQLGKQGISIDTDALNELLRRVENNTEVLVNEMKKLLLYAEGERRIDLTTIQKVITKNVEDNVYEITNSLLDNNRSKALAIYKDLIMHSEDPLRILGILVNKYREILHTKLLLEQQKSKAEIADFFNASSGRTYYIMKNARSVQKEIVIDHLNTLEKIDYDIKTGKIDKKVALELFILGQ